VSWNRWSLICWVLAVTAIAAFALGIFGRALAVSEPTVVADGAPVVLELFTSQGCSSFLPADTLLSEIGSSSRSVIAHAYHVDIGITSVGEMFSRRGRFRSGKAIMHEKWISQVNTRRK
jgi:hypothetical protein